MESRGNNHFPERSADSPILGNRSSTEPGRRNDLGRPASGFSEEGNVKPQASFPQTEHQRHRNQPPRQR